VCCDGEETLLPPFYKGRIAMSPEIGISNGYKVPGKTLPLALLRVCVFDSMGLIRASDWRFSVVDIHRG
jgi:hypothetical protein